MKNRNVFPKALILPFIVICLSFHLKTSAQEGAYWMGLSTKNPAAIGTPSDWVLGGYNYSKFQNDDKLTGFIGSADIEINPRFGSIGASYILEEIHSISIQLVELSYAYTFPLKEFGELNIGISTGLKRYENSLTEYYIRDEIDPSYIPPSDYLAKHLKTGLGAFYHSHNLDAGISYNFYSELENEFDDGYYSVNLENNFLTALAAYRFIIKKKFVIEPNVNLDFMDGNVDEHLGLFFKYDNWIWAGYSNYNLNDLHTLMAGVDIVRRVRLGYSFSFTEEYNGKRLKIHEFVLGFRIN